MYMSLLWVDISKNPRPGRIGKNCQKNRSYITSSSVSKSHSCAHGWREEQGLVKLKMNFWSMSFTSLLAIPPGRGITNHLSVYDFWLSLVYSIIYCRFSKPGGNLSPLFSFLMIFKLVGNNSFKSTSLHYIIEQHFSID